MTFIITNLFFIITLGIDWLIALVVTHYLLVGIGWITASIIMYGLLKNKEKLLYAKRNYVFYGISSEICVIFGSIIIIPSGILMLIRLPGIDNGTYEFSWHLCFKMPKELKKKNNSI